VRGTGFAVVGALAALLLASCTSPNDPNLELNSVGFNAVEPGTTLVQPAGANFSGASAQAAASASAATADQAPAASPAPAEAAAIADASPPDDVGAGLPDQVAYLPVARPAAAPQAEAATQALAAVQAEAVGQTEAAETQTARVQAIQPQDASAQTPAEPAAPSEAARPQAAPKKSLFASLFASGQPAGAATASQRGVHTAEPSRGAPRAVVKQGLPKAKDDVPPPPAASAEAAPQTFIENRPASTFIENRPAKPVIELDKPARRPVVLASYGNADDNGLPGVRQSALFEIKRKSGLDDDSDVDLHEEDDAPIQLASAAGLARLAPNGLLTQTEDVDVACLKPSLVRVLKTVEQRFGRRLIVTSGYRSRIRNIRARGAKNSLHMFCAAADIQVPGVSKLQLASFLRAMPGRGGVGTYCHTNSVHVDVGPERDWNWRCGRRKKKA
jgi:uncharacterized protein YcbK (DUF882 family)